MLNAIAGNSEIFTAYNLCETGKNLLGILNNSTYKPYKSFYSFYLLGNYSGQNIVETSGENKYIESLATIDTVSDKYYITIVNKNTENTDYTINFNLAGLELNSGKLTIRKIDKENNPDKIADEQYFINSTFSYTIKALSVINFEIFLTTDIIIPTETETNLNKNDLQINSNYLINNKLEFSYNAIENSKISIFNLAGQEVYSEAITFNLSQNKYSIDLPEMISGIYILKIMNSHQSLSQKFILKPN